MTREKWSVWVAFVVNGEPTLSGDAWAVVELMARLGCGWDQSAPVIDWECGIDGKLRGDREVEDYGSRSAVVVSQRAAEVPEHDPTMWRLARGMAGKMAKAGRVNYEERFYVALKRIRPKGRPAAARQSARLRLVHEGWRWLRGTCAARRRRT